MMFVTDNLDFTLNFCMVGVIPLRESGDVFMIGGERESIDNWCAESGACGEEWLRDRPVQTILRAG